LRSKAVPLLAGDGGVHSKPLPPRGEGVGDGGAGACAGEFAESRRGLAGQVGATPPPPTPSPQGGGEALYALPSEPGLEVRARPRRSGVIPTSERGERLAARLRANATPAEKKLWKALRQLNLDGTHFRRQAPFGPYIVDFVCHRARLIVEVDGGIHKHPAVVARDAERESWLRQRGYSVVRITNQDALFDPAGVALRIAGLIGAAVPIPTPSLS